MSELGLSITAKTKTFSLLISVFTLLFSLVISHPLYFLCLVLSFPYLLKVLSFVSPIFIIISLLLIAFLTIFATVLQKFQPKIDDGDVEDFHSLEALQVYKTVFDTSMIDGLEENPEEKILQAVESSVVKIPLHDDQEGIFNIHENSVDCEEREVMMKVMQERRIEDFLKEREEFDESVCCSVKEKKVEAPCTIVDKLVDQQEEYSSLMNGSEATAANKVGKYSSMEDSSVQMKIGREKEIGGERTCQTRVGDAFGHKTLPSSLPSASDNHVSRTRETDMFDWTKCKIKAHSQRLNSKPNGYYPEKGEEYTSKGGSSRSMAYDVGRYGSMRKEKEWKRTLACKLFEERHNNVDGGEGMDLLWETYGMELTKPNVKKNDCKSKGKIEHHHYLNEEDDEIIDGQMCCLQALKFSAGKMNMGVGKSNLVKLSKAVKGFGWLHHVISKPHRKKVHNGDTF